MCKKIIQLGLKARKTGKSSANHMIKTAKKLDQQFFKEHVTARNCGKLLRTATLLSVSGILGYVK